MCLAYVKYPFFIFAMYLVYESVENTKILVHVFVTCRLDNGNALLYGLLKYLITKLQAVLKCAACLILCKQKHDHVTPLLIQLHWLPVSQRITFKILLLTFKALNGLVQNNNY